VSKKNFNWTKNFAFGDFLSLFCIKNFCEFKIWYVFAWKNFRERPKSK